jgi:hypothetical protein
MNISSPLILGAGGHGENIAATLGLCPHGNQQQLGMGKFQNLRSGMLPVEDVFVQYVVESL